MSISVARSVWERDSAMWRYTCALVLLGAALVLAETDKRAEMSPVPFVLGSRYGRSPPRLIAPRNDRFFMGSRYGKRSEMVPLSTGLADAARAPALSSLAGLEALSGGPVPLICEFTGVFPLYRCARHSRQLIFDNRRDEESSAGDDE